MDPRRLSAGEWIAGAGAVLLLVALFLPWYRTGGEHLTAWQAMSIGDVLLAALALGVLVGLAATARRSRPVVPVVYVSLSTFAGIVAVVIAAWRLADPAPAVHVGRSIGAWLGLVGALAVAGGSWAGMDDEGPARRSPPAAQSAAQAGLEGAELLALPPDGGRAA